MKPGKVFVRTVLVAGAICLTLFLVCYIRARTKPVLDDQVRRSVDGSFVRLADGAVHYELAGDSGAPPVVLIHGSSAPYIIWDRNFHVLADQGYRVLRYDLYGRGYSDRPRIEYDRSIYIRQLVQLTGAMDLTAPLHLVALSLGGALAVGFADSLPDKVASITLISPAGPYLADMTLGKRVESFKDRINALVNPIDSTAVNRREVLEPIMPAIARQFKYRGTEWATYSFLKNRDEKGLERAFERVGRHSRPGCIIWGEQDMVLPFEFADDVKAYLPRYDIHPIPDAGHVSPFERPDTVNAILITFLDKATGRVARTSE